MKIAVLTMPLKKNYGGILQAYAMMTHLKKMGHSPELLFVQSGGNSLTWIIKDLLKRYILSYITNKWKCTRELERIEVNTDYFVDRYIGPKTNPLFGSSDFKKITENRYDAYLVGSDQVWRPGMNHYIDYAFFGFVRSDKPILLSYATSFGVDTWGYTVDQTAKYKKQIQRFSGVSVREDSAVGLCKEHFKVDATHVLDPTLMLKVDDYRKLIKQENENKLDGELLCYILDENNEKQLLIDSISKELGIKPFRVNAEFNNCKSESELEKRIYPTVTSWLKGFDDAKYVVTDSFHGCVFAILFNKPFIVYGNEERGMDRFNSLLKLFALEDRLVHSVNEISDNKIDQEIDWDRVNMKIDEYRNISNSFIIETLKNNITGDDLSE